MKKYNHEEFFFSGDEETYTTLDNTAVSDQGGGIVRLTSTDHGFKAGAYVYIQGTTNYDGLKAISAVAANTFDIVASFMAETPAGTETVKTMYSSGHAFEFLGFEIHLSEESATSENFVISKDASKGAAWDQKYYSQDMNGVQDRSNMFDIPRKCAANDKVDVVWDNTNDRLWGIILFVRRLG